MAITNVNLLNAYADLSAVSYVNVVSTIPISIAGPSGSSYVEIAQQIDASTGFQARAFYNQQLNEVVIAYSGTEGAPGNINGFNAL